MAISSATFARSPSRLVAVVCAAQVLVQIGAFFWPALLPGMIPLWQLSNSEAGWITASFYGAYMVSVPVLVTLTDRVDPKRVYLFGVAATVLGHLMFALFADGFWSALAMRALTGMGWAGTYMTGLKLLADRVDAKMMSRATAGHAASIGISGALSFACGDLIAAAAGWRAAFFAAAMSAAVAWLAVALIVPAQTKRATPAKDGQGLYDFRPVFRNRSAMAYAIAYCIHTLEMSALRGWGVAFLGYVAITTGASAASVLSPAIVATGLGLIGTFASVAGNEAAIRFGRKRLIVTAMLASILIGGTIGFRRQHILRRCCCAYHHLRHRHLARLLIPHGGNGWNSRAFATRRDARRTLHAGLCGRLCRPVADRLDARSVRRNVANRLGDIVPLGGNADGSRAHHVLADPAA